MYAALPHSNGPEVTDCTVKLILSITRGDAARGQWPVMMHEGPLFYWEVSTQSVKIL